MAGNRRNTRRGAAARAGNSEGKPRPDGFYHGVITLALTGPIVLTAWGLFGLQAGLSALVGCLLQLVIDPDLDQPSVTAAEWRMLKLPVVGRVVGSIWLAWSTLYSMAFNHRNGSRIFKHRGISHWPVIGTITRIVFFFGPPLIVYNILCGEWPAIPIEVWASCWGAMGLCDAGHWVRDNWPASR